MYFGIYTLRSSMALFITLDMAMVVDSRKKLNNSWPITRYTAKFSMPSPRMPAMRVLKITNITAHIISGLSTLQATPSTLRRYFSLKSRLIRLYSR